MISHRQCAHQRNRHRIRHRVPVAKKYGLTPEDRAKALGAHFHRARKPPRSFGVEIALGCREGWKIPGCMLR